MEINEIRCSFEEQREIKFSKKFKILLGIAIFLTGTIGILGTFLILPMSISERVWVEFGVNWFMILMLTCITHLIMFIALVKIAKSKRPFSSVIVRCMRAIGIMCIIFSIGAPWIPGFHRTGYEILALTSKIWIEGTTFHAGILFVIFSKILEYGFYYQKESDETL